MHRIFNASLLFLHLGLGSCTDLDDGDAADQLGEALLELLAIVVGGGLLDLGANLLHASLDLRILTTTVDDGRGVLVDGNALGGAEVFDLDSLELDAEILGDGLAAGENRDVLEHCLAAIAEARRLDGSDIQRATQLVDHQGCERLTVHVLGDDEQGLGGAGDLLQQGEQVLHRGDLLLIDENVGVLERNFHALGVGDEVRREVTAIELHALDDVELRFHRARLFDGDDAVLADLLHRRSDDGADLFIRVGGDGADLGNHVASNRLRELRECTANGDAVLIALADDGFNSLVDTALQRSGVRAGRNGLDALAEDGLGQDGGGGGAVASDVRGLRSDFLDELCADVFDRVRELNLLGDGDAVLGDGGRAKLLLNDDIAALGAKCHLHRVGERVDTTQDRLTRIFSMQNLLCHYICPCAGSSGGYSW